MIIIIMIIIIITDSLPFSFIFEPKYKLGRWALIWKRLLNHCFTNVKLLRQKNDQKRSNLTDFLMLLSQSLSLSLCRVEENPTNEVDVEREKLNGYLSDLCW